VNIRVLAGCGSTFKPTSKNLCFNHFSDQISEGPTTATAELLPLVRDRFILLPRGVAIFLLSRIPTKSMLRLRCCSHYLYQLIEGNLTQMRLCQPIKVTIDGMDENPNGEVLLNVEFYSGVDESWTFNDGTQSLRDKLRFLRIRNGLCFTMGSWITNWVMEAMTTDARLHGKS
jgi:hypothetical protein